MLCWPDDDTHKRSETRRHPLIQVLFGKLSNHLTVPVKAFGPHVVRHCSRHSCHFISLPVRQSLDARKSLNRIVQYVDKGSQNKSSSWLLRLRPYLTKHNGRAGFCSYRFVGFTRRKSGCGTPRETKLVSNMSP